MGAGEAPRLIERPGRFGEPDACVTVALPEALGQDHEVGPDRLRAGVAAPDAARDRGGEKQCQRREHEEPGDVVELLRPDFEPEEIEPLMSEIEQERLIRQAGSAVQPDPRQGVIDAERHDHDRPFDVAELAVNELRVNGLAPLIHGIGVLGVHGSRVGLGSARHGFFGRRRYGWHLGHNMLQSQGTHGKGTPAVLLAPPEGGEGIYSLPGCNGVAKLFK